MAFKKQVVTAVTTVKPFLYQFCNEIKNVSDKFVLTSHTEDTTSTTQWNSATFNILNNFDLIFYSTNYMNQMPAITMRCKYNDNNVFYYTQNQIGVNVSATGSINTVANYRISYRLASNNNVVSLKLGNYFSGDYVSADLIFIITDSGMPICGISSTNATNNKEQWASSELSPTPVCKSQLYDAPYYSLKYNLYDRISYEYSGHDIEIIENKVIISENVKVDTTNGLFDSSQVTPNALYMLDGLKYYAVDDHTIMRV